MIVRLKDRRPRCNGGNDKGFNSMIVRLKEVVIACINDTWKFQFYDSPIKRISFLSVKRIRQSFNSMIVRLKGQRFLRYTEIIHKFQFYDSPIKSVISEM